MDNFFRYSVLALLFAARAVCAQATFEHKFIVAAHPSLLVSAQEVDSILGDMGHLMAAKSYAWDVSCPAVNFQRSGNMVSDARLLVTGTWDQLRDNLKHVAPGANVLVVSSIECNGIKSAGCGAIGQEPLIVGQWQGLDSLIWLHERGHNVGLPHSAEAPADDSNTAPDIAWRFMFWRLGPQHVGKDACECLQFENAKLPSIVSNPPHATPTIVGSPARCVSTEARSSTGGGFMVAQGGADAQFLKQADQKKETDTKAGLTEPAAKVVERPWLDGAPLAEIKQLNKADLDSIRFLLQGAPKQGWPQAVQTLGIVGNDADVSLINRTLDFPMPKEPTASTISQIRILIQTKLAAPQALGVLANRTRSDSALQLLANTANLENATKLVGDGTLATSLSKSAIQGLTIANSPSGNSFINATVKSNLPTDGQKADFWSKDASQIKVAPFEPAEVEELGRSQKKIREFGVEAIFK
jgi:hypothetical protein